MRDPWVTRMRSLPATVVSTTLEGSLDLAERDCRERKRRRRCRPAQGGVRGAAALARKPVVELALMAAGLVDRLQVIFPVITGRTGPDPVFRDAADFDLNWSRVGRSTVTFRSSFIDPPSIDRSRLVLGVFGQEGRGPGALFSVAGAVRLRSLLLRFSRASAVVGKSAASPAPTCAWFSSTNPVSPVGGGRVVAMVGSASRRACRRRRGRGWTLARSGTTGRRRRRRGGAGDPAAGPARSGGLGSRCRRRGSFAWRMAATMAGISQPSSAKVARDEFALCLGGAEDSCPVVRGER